MDGKWSVNSFLLGPLLRMYLIITGPTFLGNGWNQGETRYLVSQGSSIHGQGKMRNHIWEVTWIEYGYKYLKYL
jgi:hypothetical protein